MSSKSVNAGAYRYKPGSAAHGIYTCPRCGRQLLKGEVCLCAQRARCLHFVCRANWHGRYYIRCTKVLAFEYASDRDAYYRAFCCGDCRRCGSYADEK